MPTLITQKHHDVRLWMTALGLSLLANTSILLLAGFASLSSRVFFKESPPPPPIPAETTVIIFPDMAAVSQGSSRPLTSQESSKPRFARTSEDQAAEVPEKAAFIGERNTLATSDRPANPTAPPQPSQSGIAPKDDSDFETTESRYQEGMNLANPADALAAKSAPPPTPAETAIIPHPAVPSSPPTSRGKLLEGPNPVDVPVPKNDAAHQETKPSPEARAAAETAPTLPKPTNTSTPKPLQTPSAKGYQRKTAIVGAISRTGHSALDVADSPLGRYQAVISRAVEQEWQRNCVRHRDFITPGFLTVRFFVEPTGHVRTVQFIGDMETGEVQKGFTLNSIRDAVVPAMPASLKKEFADGPLEIIFNFYF